MNEKSGAQEKAVTSPSPAGTESTPKADPKVDDNEGETRVENQSSVENEAKKTENAADVTEEVAAKATEVTDVEAKTPSDSTQVDEQMEVDVAPPVKSTSPESAPSSSEPADDPLLSRLAEVVKTISEPAASADSHRVNSESAHKDADSATLSTENLISMLEGSNTEKEASDDAVREAAPMSESQPRVSAAESQPQVAATESQAPVAASASQPVLPASESKPPQSVSELPPPRSTRKYIYKLKSKTGKVLKYVSCIPIVLKRPVITLTKMEEEEDDDDESKNELPRKVARTEADDGDSDNSTKENNVKANDASTGVVGPRIARKRGRPPLSQKAPVITLDDHHTSDATVDAKESFKSVAGGSASTPSYGVQTRKRQLKFLPDGRVVTPAGKKYKSAAAAAAAAVAAAASSAKEKLAHDENQLSDTDVLSESDDGSQSASKTKKLLPAVATKKFTPLERKIAEKKGNFKKVFDYESYFRENSSTPTEPKDAKQAATTAKRLGETPKSAPAKPAMQGRSNASVSTPGTSKFTAAAPTNNSSASTSTPATASKNTVDPAQLLSSLIGVTILPHQLNLVKFKPKVIQDRKTMSAQKNVTFVDETPTKKNVVVGQREPLQQQQQHQRNTPYKVSSKPSLQKILPKPLSSPDRASTLIRKTMEMPKTTTTSSATSRLAVTSSKLNAALTSPISSYSAVGSYRYGPTGDAPTFDCYTDTKVVKTKEGPKKYQKRQRENVDDEVKTVYDLVQNVFEQIPSWNLHIIPDTNSFCIAQVSRGRMGIPILKKSIELNADFGAKVYVHQLHCKKYDGVYDTESKIMSLIREIDALAA